MTMSAHVVSVESQRKDRVQSVAQDVLAQSDAFFRERAGQEGESASAVAKLFVLDLRSLGAAKKSSLDVGIETSLVFPDAWLRALQGHSVFFDVAVDVDAQQRQRGNDECCMA